MTISSKHTPAILYFLLWCLYSLQGTLYASGGIISRSILLILLLWSIYGCFKVNTRYKELPSFLKAINVFLIMATIYGGILIVDGQQMIIKESAQETSNFDYLKNIYMSMLPLYVFYDFSRRGIITLKHLKWFGLILLAVAVASFFRIQNENMQMALEMRSDSEEFTNNTGYSFVALMPLLIFWHKKPIVQYLLLLVCIGFIIVAMKRGAILIGALCFVYFLYKMLKESRGGTKIAIIVLSAVAIMASIRIVGNMLATSEYFVSRLEQTAEGDSSNRDVIYSRYYNHFINETNPVKILFGNGANATLTVGMNYAHNDWLEIAVNNGLLGLIIYILYFVALFRDWLRCRKRIMSYYSAALIMSFMILFSKTLFSMSYSEIDISQTLVIGFVLAMLYGESYKKYGATE